jgi:hypothetical protein
MESSVSINPLGYNRNKRTFEASKWRAYRAERTAAKVFSADMRACTFLRFLRASPKPKSFQGTRL